MKYLIIGILLQLSAVAFGQDTIVIKEKNNDTAYVDSAGMITLTFNPKTYFYQYDSSLGDLLENFDKGYINRFSIANRKFRIRATDSNCCVVEIFKANRWQKNFSFQLTQYGYDTSKDINDDGHNDFVSYWKWFGEVHLFNPKENKFFDSTNCGVDYDWILLDTSKKIFCDMDEGNLMGKITSTLYTFKNYQRVDLFNLDIIVNRDSDFSVEKEILYEGTGQVTKIAEIVPKEKIDVEDFDYKSFG